MENTENKEVTKDPKARSRLYPRYNLEEAIKFIEIVSKLGRKNISEKSVAAESGKSITNSGFIGRMSSAKQFALISKDGGKLSLTQLGNEIMFPPEDAIKIRAIKKAFTMPTLFRELIDTFGGTKIPEFTSLGNRLLNDYGIEAGAKDMASKNFIKSAEYAGLIQNGILVVDAEISSQDSDSTDVVDVDKSIDYSMKKNIARSDDIVFEFSGGMKLLIPRNKKSSDAVMDGELKEVRTLLTKFAESFVVEDITSDNINK